MDSLVLFESISGAVQPLRKTMVLCLFVKERYKCFICNNLISDLLYFIILLFPFHFLVEIICLYSIIIYVLRLRHTHISNCNILSLLCRGNRHGPSVYSSLQPRDILWSNCEYLSSIRVILMTVDCTSGFETDHIYCRWFNRGSLLLRVAATSHRFRLYLYPPSYTLYTDLSRDQSTYLQL